MRISRSKTTATVIALFLMFAMAVTLVALPSANAHTPPWTVPSWTLVAVGPNPVGVGQQIWIDMWTRPNPPTATAADLYIYMVDVMLPSGSNETLGPITSDVGGNAFTIYTPAQAGNYTFVAKFQGITLRGGPGATVPSAINDTILPSSSTPMHITVQETPIETWQESPLPTQFWTRPINQLNKGWYPIASNWLGKQSGAHTQAYGFISGSTAPGWVGLVTLGVPRLYSNSPAPESSHVMWTRPIWTGGIADERYGVLGYLSVTYTGFKLYPPIILDGRLIYSTFDSAESIGGWSVVDLYTGKTIAVYNTTSARAQGNGPFNGQPSFASINDVESLNTHAAFPYIWITSGVTLPEGYTSAPRTSTWEVLDGYTYNPVYMIANISQVATAAGSTVPGSGTVASGAYAVYGDDGSILRYNLVTQNVTNGVVQYLQCWNATQAIQPWSRGGSSGFKVVDGDSGWSLNKSLSSPVYGNILQARAGQYLIGGTGGHNNGTTIIKGNLWALSLEPGQEGTLLWNITFTPPQTVVPDIVDEEIYGNGEGQAAATKHRIPVGLDTVDPEDGVFTFAEGVTLRRWGYSLKTGQQLWGPTDPESQFNYWDSMPSVAYQGMLISYGYSGVVTGYNITTGEILWTYTAKGVGYESPYINSPLYIDFVADGKLYFDSSEHSPNSPLSRGYNLRCVNASNGVELWKLANFGTGTDELGTGGIENAAIADGYIVAYNGYDNQIYCIGKGPSATTVTAPNVGVTTATPITITGTVTDISAGASQLAVAANFPNGLPCVSDDSMDAWMEHIYEQQPMPANVTGVPVTISVLDSNGNYREIGTTTSDVSGTFAFTWTPDIPGDFTVYANFAGSKSYYPSSAEAYFYASTTPAATPAPTPTPAPMTDTYVLSIGAAAIIAIVVIGLLIILMLRKR
jgi:hypothetical protein